MGPVVELERRDAAVRIALQKLGRARRARVEVEIRPFVRPTELREQQADLVTVAGIQIVEQVHRAHLRGEPADSIGGHEALRDV